MIDILALCAKHCAGTRIPDTLAFAMCKVESSLDEFAWNPEPPYKYLWDVKRKRPFRKLTPEERVSEIPPLDFPSGAGARDAEWWGQQASWGPIQIMGGTAREFGFTGHFPGLCSEKGIAYGVLYLRDLYRRFFTDFGMDGVIVAYNAGSPRLTASGDFENQEYLVKVHEALR